MHDFVQFAQMRAELQLAAASVRGVCVAGTERIRGDAEPATDRLGRGDAELYVVSVTTDVRSSTAVTATTS